MKRLLTLILTLPLVFYVAADGLSHGIGGEITRGVKFVVSTETPVSFSEVSIDLNFGIEISYPFDVIGTLSSFHYDENGFRWKGVEIMPRFDIGYWEIMTYNIVGLYLAYTEPHIHGDHVNTIRKIFKSGIAHFMDIEFFKHLFHIEIWSRFNFYPRFGLNTDISPNLIILEIEGKPHTHLALTSTFNIHTHFDGEIFFEVSPGLVLEMEPLYFEITYGIIERNISSKFGINIQF